MHANGCPVPAGTHEKDDLVDRVQEMMSFNLSAKVRGEEEEECKICMDNLAEYCLVPCGHTGMCLNCARLVESCPFCKSEVRHVQKLWRV
jgi:Zinc finger, C3HC4 type (RING finger)